VKHKAGAPEQVLHPAMTVAPRRRQSDTISKRCETQSGSASAGLAPRDHGTSPRRGCSELSESARAGVAPSSDGSTQLCGQNEPSRSSRAAGVAPSNDGCTQRPNLVHQNVLNLRSPRRKLRRKEIVAQLLPKDVIHGFSMVRLMS
jgi:hypothetical protein